MHEYDTTPKRILTRLAGSVLAKLTGFTVERWHNVELPVVSAQRADLLGETRDGQLVHIELQSVNDSLMALRVLEYALAIKRRFGRFPKQIVLYVGNAPLRMSRQLAEPELSFGYRLVDIRELDSAPLLASGFLEDNVVAVLTRLGDESEAVRRILERIAASPAAERETVLAELMILAGLRNLEEVIGREMEKMPILNDIMDHKVFGPKIRLGIELGRKEGMELGERRVILRLLDKRFGPLPEWVGQRLNELSAEKLERLELRLLDASTIEELFG